MAIWVINDKSYEIEKRRLDMSILLNLQMSVFGNHNIEATAENITSLMSKLNTLGKYEFLPNVVTGQNIDLVKGIIEPSMNLSFSTSNKNCQIMCMDNRIDCTMNFNSENQDAIENAMEFPKNVLTLLMEDYKILGNRLAVNINVLSDAFNEEEKKKFVDKAIVSSLNYYCNKSVDEWQSRTNSRIQVELGKQNEIVNVITELNYLVQSAGEEKRLHCHWDINTIPENNVFRFSSKHIGEFTEGMKEIIMELSNCFKEMSICG